MSEKTETPTATTMLYRLGEIENPAAWNRKLDIQVVEDGDAAAAQAEGWLTAAELAKADAEAAKAPAKAAK